MRRQRSVAATSNAGLYRQVTGRPNALHEDWPWQSLLKQAVALLNAPFANTPSHTSRFLASTLAIMKFVVLC